MLSIMINWFQIDQNFTAGNHKEDEKQRKSQYKRHLELNTRRLAEQKGKCTRKGMHIGIVGDLKKKKKGKKT